MSESKTKDKAKAKGKGKGKGKGKAKGKAKGKGKAKRNTEADLAAAEEERKQKQIEEETQQLRDALRKWKQEVEDETKLMNDFQQQKDVISKFWDIEKQTRENVKLELRDRVRQKLDLEEKHDFELKVYKEKVKHLLYEQQSSLADTTIDEEQELNAAQDAERDDNHTLRVDLRQLQVARKEKELAHFNLLKSLRQEQEKKIMGIRKEFERKLDELLACYRKREKTVRQDFLDQRNKDVTRINDRKDAHIKKLMALHKQAFDDIKSYYRDITHNNLDLIKQLRDQVNSMKKEDQKREKEVLEVNRVNQKLSQPLQDNLKLLTSLKDDLNTYEREKVALAAAKHRLVVLEEQVKHATWEYDILEQKLEQLTAERDELKEKLHNTLFESQQKTGFRNLVLERKITLLNEQLEQADAAIQEILRKVNVPPEVAADFRSNVKDVMRTKESAIEDLQVAVDNAKQAYYDTVATYEDKLREYDIAPEELGFVPPEL